MSMDKALIGVILFYYIGIVFLMIYMFKKRKAAVLSGTVKVQHFKSYAGETTDELRVIQNHVNSQFQMPVIFFFACLLNLQQGTVSAATLALAVIFVLSRVAHSCIHLGSNHILRRAFSFFIGTLAVGGLLAGPLWT